MSPEAMSPESDEEFGEKELPALLEAKADGELASLRDALVEGATAFSGGPQRFRAGRCRMIAL